MNPTINTFIFDCFGVLSNPVLVSWYQNHSLKDGFVDDNLFRVLEEFDLGKIGEEDILEYFSKYKGVTMSKEDIRREVDSYLKLDSKLVALVLKLRGRGLKIVLLTNANASFFEREVYVKYPDFKKLFNEIIISSEVGMIKPNRDIYLYTLEKVGSKPEECILIDDSKRNIEGAAEVGITGHLYTDFETFHSYLKQTGMV